VLKGQSFQFKFCPTSKTHTTPAKSTNVKRTPKTRPPHWNRRRPHSAPLQPVTQEREEAIQPLSSLLHRNGKRPFSPSRVCYTGTDGHSAPLELVTQEREEAIQPLSSLLHRNRRPFSPSRACYTETGGGHSAPLQPVTQEREEAIQPLSSLLHRNGRRPFSPSRACYTVTAGGHSAPLNSVLTRIPSNPANSLSPP